MSPSLRQEIVEAAHLSIRKGSKSFSAASQLFGQTERERAWLLYAWCRVCDDLVDGQDHGSAPLNTSDAKQQIAKIHALTTRAMTGELTGDPAFDALAVVAQETALTQEMTDDVIAGFELDARGWRPRTEADMLRYCYHVAGAVGVMMAVVMGVAPNDEDTLDRACDLGIAFQLANIARDISDDDTGGRCYLPMDWLAEADIPPGEMMKPHYRQALVPLVARLCDLAEQYEASARIGAARLPFRQRWAILSAAGIYGAIGRQVRKQGAHAWDHRAYVPRAQKLGIIFKAFADCWTKTGRDVRPEPSRRELAAMARDDASR